MKPRKKNKYFTFICSFIPGAAEMYMGFMKSGFSLFTLFVAPVVLVGLLQGADYIVILSGIVYMVSFFHARNIATAPEYEFNNLEDKFIWEEYLEMKKSNISASVYKKWLAIALIFIGGCGLWSLFKENILNMLSYFSLNTEIIMSLINSVPRFVFSVLIIIFGIVLIMGKKKALTEEQDESH